MFATKSGNGPFLSFDADAFVRRLGELRTGAELPDVAVVRETMSIAATEGALTCDMNGQSAFPAEWPAFCPGLHLICTGDNASPAHVAEQAFCAEFAMSSRNLRVLRVGAWGMDLSDLRSPLSEEQRHGAAPMVTERIIHSVRQSVRGVELAMVYHPDLAVFDDVTGRVQARLAAYVAGKGIRTLAVMRADTAFGALLMLDRMGISRASLGLLGRIEVVSMLGSGNGQSNTMLRERHDCTPVFLARCVGKMPKPPRPRASPFARPMHAAPDPTGGRVPFNLVLADMMERVVLAREKQSKERTVHNVKTYHAMLLRSHRVDVSRPITGSDFPQHGQSHHGRKLDRTSLSNSWRRYELLAPMDMAKRLRRGDDVGANHWAMSACREARHDMSRVAEGMMPAGARNTDIAEVALMHRNLLMGLLSELEPDTWVMRTDNDQGRLVTAIEVARDAWSGGNLAVEYSAGLCSMLARGLTEHASGYRSLDMG